jgi:TolA-binding protein
MKNIVLLLLLTLLTHSYSYANIRKEFADLEAQFQTGNLDSVAGNLMNLKPQSAEEKAFIAYYTARLDKSMATAKVSYNQLVSKYPSTKYGQLGILELAKISVLDRNIEAATDLLRRITNNDISERTYWQAVCSFQSSDWQNAISHSENYLRIAPQSHLVEDTYYLIANCYLSQGKAHSAITSLNKLHSIEGQPTDMQHFHFLLGNAYEANSNIRDAVSQYKEGYLLNKYSQMAYRIEDRLFEMRSMHGSIVDIGFLYPYTELSLQDVSHIVHTDPSPQTTNGKSEFVADAPLKASSKPMGDYFIQAGRFSSETNALNLVKKIRSYEIPAVYYDSMHNDKMTWVVVSGPYSNQQEAIFAHSKLRENEIDCFITRN